jgi:uncharacterized DUF497 family protein
MYVQIVVTVVHGDFEWDDAKAESNLAKHGVAFEEAVLAMKTRDRWISKTSWNRPI